MLSKVVLGRSDTADTRTCDASKVTQQQLLNSSMAHKRDVSALFGSVCMYLRSKAELHDCTKITRIDWFFDDFKTGFASHGWYDMHRKAERHHIAQPDGIPKDVDLFDVLEHLIDNVTACVARTGDKKKYRFSNLSPEMLLAAVKFTEQKLLDAVECHDWEAAE